jgi:hypothetical protein
MADETTATNSPASASNAAQAASNATQATAPTLLGAPEQAAPGAAQTAPYQATTGQATTGQAAKEKAAFDAARRTEAWAVAATPEGKKAAYEALNAEEKAAAFKALSEADRKALAIEDPTLPVYDVAKFTAPEGVTLDGEALKPALELFKESRLSQDQAQKFIDLAVSREQAAATKGVQAFVELQNKWVSEVKADPDIGGTKLMASLASAARAIDRLGVPGLKEALDLTGAGNHPAVVKAFVRLGQMVSEDRFARGSHAEPAAPRSLAETIYGDSPKQSADA